MHIIIKLLVQCKCNKKNIYKQTTKSIDGYVQQNKITDINNKLFFVYKCHSTQKFNTGKYIKYILPKLYRILIYITAKQTSARMDMSNSSKSLWSEAIWIA